MNCSGRSGRKWTPIMHMDASWPESIVGSTYVNAEHWWGHPMVSQEFVTEWTNCPDGRASMKRLR